MNLAIEHNYQDDLLHTIECAQRVGCHTMFLNCNVPHDIHKPWVRDIIASCKNFYFIVRMPIYYLGTPEPTDSHVMGYICAGSNELRGRVLAVHLTQGAIDVNNYLLRLYGMLRKGLTFKLIVDDLHDSPGYYRIVVYDAAFAVMSDVEREQPLIMRAATLQQMLKARFNEHLVMCIITPELIERRKTWVRLLSW
jgi:hypothetical protein